MSDGLYKETIFKIHTNQQKGHYVMSSDDKSEVRELGVKNVFAGADLASFQRKPDFLSEAELIEGLTPYTAHADELIELGLDELESVNSNAFSIYHKSRSHIEPIMTIGFDTLNEQMMKIGDPHGSGAEKIVQTFPLDVLRKFHTWQIENGLIVLDTQKKLNTEETKSPLPLAIMTFIACGEELGAKLEVAFPEYKDSNPKHCFSKQQVNK